MNLANFVDDLWDEDNWEDEALAKHGKARPKTQEDYDAPRQDRKRTDRRKDQARARRAFKEMGEASDE